MSDHLFKRGPIWWCWIEEDGKQVCRSTRCTDRAAAKLRLAQLERQAASPGGTAAATATLGVALEDFLRWQADEHQAGKITQATLEFYIGKAAHWTRILGEKHGLANGRDLLLAKLDSPEVDHYIQARRAEWALPPRPGRYAKGDGRELRPPHLGRHISDYTISRELLVLRLSLERAKRARLFHGDLDLIMPADFSTGYEPRERFLPPEELEKLVPELALDDAARVSFIVATSARLKEAGAARKEDVGKSFVRLRGTKTDLAERQVSIFAGWQRQLLDFALAQAQGEDGLFKPWRRGNSHRELKAACRRAGIAVCSPNDLRRTFGVWTRAAGIPIDVLARMLGHVDSKMAERVYARLTPDLLDGLIRRLTQRACSAGVVEDPSAKAPMAEMAARVSPETPEIPQNGAGPRGFEPLAFGFVGQSPLTLRARDYTRKQAIHSMSVVK